MPSLSLFGLRWHSCTDSLPILGAVLTTFNAFFLTIYVIFMVLYARPEECGRTQHYVVVWGTLGLLIASVVLGSATICIGITGTPFQPSKRRLMQPVLYLQSLKWIVLLGWLPYAIFAVYSSPSYCWHSRRRSLTIGLLWTVVGVMVAVYLTGICTYNMLSKYDAANRWQKRLVLFSRLLGCYRTLQHAASDRSEFGAAPLQEIAGMFARFFGNVDVEKTDIVAGFVLAEIMQVQQRRARVADSLQRHGLGNIGEGVVQQWSPQAHGASSKTSVQDGAAHAAADSAHSLPHNGANPSRPRSGVCKGAEDRATHGGVQSALEGGHTACVGCSEELGSEAERTARGERDTWESNTTYEQTAGYVEEYCELCRGCQEGEGGVEEGGTGSGSGMEHGSDLQMVEVSARPGIEAEGKGGAGCSKDHVSLNLDSPLFRWLRDISEGQNFCLTPSGWGAKLAPDLSPRECAELYTGSSEYVERSVLEETRHWYKFAVAAYGKGGYLYWQPKQLSWRSLPFWRARARLWGWVHPQSRVERRAKAPVRQKLEGSKKYVKHYRGAQGVTGITDDDFVYTSFTNAALGSTPYLILLDRPTRTVVLSIRGTQSYEDLITDLIDRPVDISDWVPQDIKQEHEIDGPVKAHAGMFSAAKSVLQDLNRHQILQILLRGEPLPEEARQEERDQCTTDERDAQAPGWQPSRHSRPCVSSRGPTEDSNERQGVQAQEGQGVEGGVNRTTARASSIGGGSAGRCRAGKQVEAQDADQAGQWGQSGQGAIRFPEQVRFPEQEQHHWGQQQQAQQQAQQRAEGARMGQPEEEEQVSCNGGESSSALPGTAPAARHGWLWQLSLPLWRRGALHIGPATTSASTQGVGLHSTQPAPAPTAAGPSKQGWFYPPGGWVGLLSHPMLGGPVWEGTPASRCLPGYAEMINAQRQGGGPPAAGAGGATAGQAHEPASNGVTRDWGTGGRDSERGAGEHFSRQGESSKGAGAEEEQGPGYYQQVFEERELDCRGWNFVIVGHSLGAAVASFIGMHCRSWYPGLKVWAFNPPGGMITANLSHAMHDFVTSVIVGKDIVSRTGTVAFERLIDQAIVALARTRLSKMRILLQSKSKSLRKAAPEKVFCPVEEIPREALNYVRGYFESKCKYRKTFVPMFPPGRTMQLRRLKDAKGQESWDAVWIRAEQIMEEGILLSSHQSSDHYTARLTHVFGELLGRDGDS